MARHADGGRRPGVAPWLVVTAVVLAVLAAATVVWVSVTGRDDQAATTCTGSAVLSVLASPGAAEGMTGAAAAFDATRPVARSTCITTSVDSPSDGSIAASRLIDRPVEDAPGPAIWVAQSESEVADLESGNAALTAGRDDRPEATSPVVLAVRAPDARALAGAAWVDLPQVFAVGGPLTLVLPDPLTNRASSYALQSVVAGATGARPADTGVAPAVDAAAVTAATPALQSLAVTADPARTTAAALAALQAGQAVPVVESELIAWNRSRPDEGLTAVHPTGPVVGDTVLLLQLTAPWVDATATDAAGRFAGFVRSVPGRQALADAGLRVEGVTPADPDSQVDQSGTADLIAPAGIDVTGQLVAALRG